jgi:NADH dehydrogenase
MQTILVTGASGFVGSHVLPELLGAGHRVVALVRTARAGEKVTQRLPATLRASVELRTGDVGRPATLPTALAGVDAVVHLVAIPRDRNGGRDLLAVNLDGTRNVVAAMKVAGVRRLVHLGALGVVDREELHYAKSKARAERVVAESDLDWTILKPSLLFGPGDGFFNIIAGLVRMTPGIVPVPGDGKSRFQPLHVGDLALCLRLALERPDTVGRACELGGPRIWTYR